MNATRFRELVKGLTWGKKVRGNVYLHKTAFEAIDESALRDFVWGQIDALTLGEGSWNVVKLNPKEFKVSLLSYPGFFDNAYPELTQSWTLNLRSGELRQSSFNPAKNPPILHRKETLLHPEHPDIPMFAEITREGEAAGLYENQSKIGFKKQWNALIREKGFRLEKGRLVEDVGEAKSRKPSPKEVEVEIQRHRTAIQRYSLSKPMQQLYQHGFLEGEFSVFDYGCGRGDDLRILREHQLDASGWDPVFAPDEAIEEADLVNLGYVINVIEDPREREQTLRKAYRLARKLLVVSAMLKDKNVFARYERYGDGVITTRATFQKYYSQKELREYLESALGHIAIAVSPGIFFIFQDPMAEQDFLVNLNHQKKRWKPALRSTRGAGARKKALFEAHKKLFERFWSLCLELGRIPKEEECKDIEKLKALIGSTRKTYRFLCDYFEPKDFEEAAETRRKDLLVYFARNVCYKLTYKSFPPTLKQDIKVFFGAYTKALEEARELLFSLTDTGRIERACVEAFELLEVGKLEEGKAYTIHRRHLNDLPTLLRVYVNCALLLYGGIEQVDLIKIHMHSGKVSFMVYDDFDGKPLPLLLERIKVKLRLSDVDFFEYKGRYKPHPLYWKSQYMDEEGAFFTEQSLFDRELSRLCAQEDEFELTKYGPSWSSLQGFLASQGRKVEGFRLVEIEEASDQRWQIAQPSVSSLETS